VKQAAPEKRRRSKRLPGLAGSEHGVGRGRVQQGEHDEPKEHDARAHPIPTRLYRHHRHGAQSTLF